MVIEGFVNQKLTRLYFTHNPHVLSKQWHHSCMKVEGLRYGNVTVNLLSVLMIPSHSQAKKQAVKERQKERRAAKRKGQAFSTAINLTEPREQQVLDRLQHVPGAEQDAFSGVEPAMPEAVQQYMLRQGFNGLTPIQERCAHLLVLKLAIQCLLICPLILHIGFYKNSCDRPLIGPPGLIVFRNVGLRLFPPSWQLQ